MRPILYNLLIKILTNISNSTLRYLNKTLGLCHLNSSLIFDDFFCQSSEGS